MHVRSLSRWPNVIPEILIWKKHREGPGKQFKCVQQRILLGCKADKTGFISFRNLPSDRVSVVFSSWWIFGSQCLYSPSHPLPLFIPATVAVISRCNMIAPYPRTQLNCPRVFLIQRLGYREQSTSTSANWRCTAVNCAMDELLPSNRISLPSFGRKFYAAFNIALHSILEEPNLIYPQFQITLVPCSQHPIPTNYMNATIYLSLCLLVVVGETSRLRKKRKNTD